MALVLGLAGDEAVPALLKLLKHRNARVRLAAARALGELSPQKPEALEALAKAAQDSHRAVRLGCLDALFLQGTWRDDQSRWRVDTLVKMAGHPDAPTRVWAGRLLVELQRNEHHVANGNAEVVQVVTKVLLEALQRQPLGEEKVRPLVTQMHRFKHTGDLLPSADDPDPEVREHVAVILGQANLWQEQGEITDEDRASVLSILERLLSDRKESVRQQAARALGQSGAWARGSIGKLQETLKDRHRSVREAAAIALWKINGQTVAVLPLLVESLGREEYDAPGLIDQVRAGHAPSETLITLVEMDTRAEKALVEALTHEQAAMRAGAAVVLGSRETDSPATVGLALSAALTDASAMVRLQTACALRYQGQVDQETIVSRLASALVEDPDQRIALAALTTLGGLGPRGNSAPEDYLLERLTDPWEEMRAEAVRILLRWGKQAETTIPALRHALKDRSPTVRERAVQTLAEIGVAALPALDEALVADKDIELRKQVVVALAGIGEAVRPLLEKALKDSDEEVRAKAAAALEQ
jgi:HEAT repeat protein